MSPSGKSPEKKFTIALLGNPNCGKSTLFNQLTGSTQRIGNWPGVTVDKKTGQYTYEGTVIEVVDLPGTYSLDNAEGSLDEKITRDFILSSEADLIVNILDASSLERNLYLSTQVLEMQVPIILALNMMDLADQHGFQIRQDNLAEAFGCNVVPIVATKNQGVDDLKLKILSASQARKVSVREVKYPDSVVKAIDAIEQKLDSGKKADVSLRWVATQLLESERNEEFPGVTAEAVELASTARSKLEEELKEDMDIAFGHSRYEFARQVANSAMEKEEEYRKSISDHIDSVVLNRFLGVPVFLTVIYLMFLFTINFGGAFIDVFDLAAGAVFVDGAASVYGAIGLPDWLNVVLSSGLGGGLQVVATFIPIIGFLYMFLAILEDSGYMARAAFVVDRFMRRLGLPGKSFVPLVVGFGCNVPAVMATRTLDNHRERIITVLMAPFMSCGARLSVYALFAAAFFPVGGQNVVFALYIVGILFAMLTAVIVKFTLLPGEASPFLIELPTYHVPTVKGVMLRTWSRLKGFLKDAGKIIILMVLVINVLNSVGTDGSIGNEDSESSLLSSLSKTMTPIFSPLGIREDNWPATVGIFTGVLAKEVVVGTLDAIYSTIDLADGGGGEEEEFVFSVAMGEALQTVPDNLVDAWDNILDPLGLGVLESGASLETAAQEQEVDTATFGAMVKRFDGQAGAFAYLLFVLLYTPCVATIGAIYREAGRRWMNFTIAWSTGIAFMASTCFYQAARFGQHPGSSTAWIVGWFVALGVVVLVMRKEGQKQGDPNRIPITQL